MSGSELMAFVLLVPALSPLAYCYEGLWKNAVPANLHSVFYIVLGKNISF